MGHTGKLRPGAIREKYLNIHQAKIFQQCI